MKVDKLFFFLLFIVSFITVLLPRYCSAQKKAAEDNGYIITYPKNLMVRLFFSQKFAPFTISSRQSQDLNYKTNSKLNLGVGATYNSFSANLSYGFKFLNKDKGQGATKGLDLQIHLYPHKWAIDLLGTFVTGYYLDPKDDNGLHLANYYQRPDVKRSIAGFSVFRVSNANKFSYKAAVIQNELQTRSAGSLLYGGEIYYGSAKGDSALVPPRVNSLFEQAGINKVSFFSVGPGIGYAYTLILYKNYFITGSLIGILDLNFSSEEKAGATQKKVSVLPGGIFKGAVGYNSGTWSISANVIGNALYAGSAVSSKEYFLPTGNMQLIFATKLKGKSH